MTWLALTHGHDNIYGLGEWYKKYLVDRSTALNSLILRTAGLRCSRSWCQ